VAPRRLFALDQNFPEPIVRSLDTFLECAELVPVRLIDERMPRLEDWELLKAIHDHERDWDGLITSDDSMLNDARAMAVLKRTGLTLVIAHGQGHNPVRATGLLLFHLDHICVHTVAHRPQIFLMFCGVWPQREPSQSDEERARHPQRKIVVPWLLRFAMAATRTAGSAACVRARRSP
jgi:hypothetical protein